MDAYLGMKKSELLALARQADIAGRSRMNKTQLARALASLSEAVEKRGDQVPGSFSADAGVGDPAFPVSATPELPPFLNERRLCLLPQGPRVAFAYWELENDPECEMDFVVHGLPDSGKVFSCKARGRCGNFYVHLERAGMMIESTLSVEGLQDSVLLLRSNAVQMPNDQPALELDTLWMTRRKDFEEIFRLSGGVEGENTGAGERLLPEISGMPSSWPGRGSGEER